MKKPQRAQSSPSEAKGWHGLVLQAVETPQRRGLHLLFLASAVAAIVIVVHWPALSSKAISFDDHQYLIDNELVRDPSWHSARRFLTEVLEPSTVSGYYQPLAMISLM